MRKQTTSAMKLSASVLGSEESFRLLVNNIRDYAIVLLDPDGQVASWNPGAERIKGYRAEEIIGKHFSCFYPPEAIERGLPEQELKTAAKDGRFEDEGWRVKKDGTKFWANAIITALRNPEGKLCGFGKMTRDLTERKQAEERIQLQAKEIMELSTPVLQVWQGVVAAPLIG
jgi:PAS domain S-box-containing protein